MPRRYVTNQEILDKLKEIEIDNKVSPLFTLFVSILALGVTLVVTGSTLQPHNEQMTVMGLVYLAISLLVYLVIPIIRRRVIEYMDNDVEGD